MIDSGSVYIVTNKGITGLYKIGFTRGDIKARVKSLNSTSVPFDFELLKEYKTDHVAKLEKYIHRKFRTNRVSSSREFFSFGDEITAIKMVDRAVVQFEPPVYTPKEEESIKRESSADNTASHQAKRMGLKNLKQVSDITGVKRGTLSNWSRDKPKLFKVVLLGCVETIKQGEG